MLKELMENLIKKDLLKMKQNFIIKMKHYIKMYIKIQELKLILSVMVN